MRIKAVEEKLSVLEKQQEDDAILAVSKETEYVKKLDEGILPDEYTKQKSLSGDSKAAAVVQLFGIQA